MKEIRNPAEHPQMWFEPVLVNPVDGDPALLVRINGLGYSCLFDCGNLTRLAIRDLLRIRRLFVTHTHIDHFVGFDTLVRMQLFCSHTLEVYGPAPLIRQVAGKLAGYTWNLVSRSQYEIAVTEFEGDLARRQTFACRDQFRPGPLTQFAHQGGLELPDHLELRFAAGHHGVDCLAYSLNRPRRVSVDKAALKASGLPAGSWLSELKQMETGTLMAGATRLEVAQARRELLVERPAEKLTYITDTLYEGPHLPGLIELAAGADTLFCEASYTEDELLKAHEHLHMTAAQAGRLAAAAQVGTLHLFHMSRRYQSDEQSHLTEARSVFANTQPAPIYA